MQLVINIAMSEMPRYIPYLALTISQAVVTHSPASIAPRLN